MRRKVLAVSLFAAMLLLACSLSSALDFAKKAGELAPTAQALASQVGPTVEAAMTQVGPTMEAAMTQMGPTMQAVMTQGAQMMTQEAPGQQNGGGGQANAMNWLLPEESTILKSFHQEMIVHVKAAGKAYDLYKIETDSVRGQASRQVIVQNGQPVMEMVSVGGTTWYRAGDEWISVPSSQNVDNPEALVADAMDSELADPAHWKANGTGTVEGMKVYRYTYNASQDLAAMNQDWQGLLMEIPQLSGATNARVTKVQGEVSVLQDGTMVSAFYRVEGQVEQNGQQVPVEVTVTTTLSNLNGDIQITPPPGAAGAKAPIPLPPGATLEMQMGASSIYTVPDMTVAQVMQFFDQAFAQQGYKVTTKVGDDQNGWTLQVTDPQGKMHMLMVASQDGKVSITIVK